MSRRMMLHVKAAAILADAKESQGVEIAQQQQCPCSSHRPTTMTPGVGLALLAGQYWGLQPSFRAGEVGL